MPTTSGTKVTEKYDKANSLRLTEYINNIMNKETSFKLRKFA